MSLGRKATRLEGEGTIELWRAAPKGAGIRPCDFAADSAHEAGFYLHGGNVVQSTTVPRRDVFAIEGSMGGGREYVHFPKDHVPVLAVQHYASFKSFFEAANRPESSPTQAKAAPRRLSPSP